MISIDTFLIGKRWWKYWYQRRTKGFDNSETWNLNDECAAWLLPRLKRFKELNKLFNSFKKFKLKIKK